jgi:hypothetical protein
VYYTVCRQTFAHKRRLKAAETDDDVVPPVSIPVPEDCVDTDTPDASNATEVTATFEVCITSETVVTAPLSWLTTHDVDVLLTWTAEFTFIRESDASSLVSSSLPRMNVKN